MKGLLWLLAAFALAVGLSLALRGNDGYVLLVQAPWRIELSINLFLILLVAGFAIAYLVTRVVVQTLSLPGYVKAFHARQRERKGRNALVRALQALYEGRFARAEKLASQSADLGETSALASLVAARAAQRLRNFSARDQWLERAREADADWRQAVAAVQAELLIEERRFVEARAVLRELHAGGAKHIATLVALFRAEQGLGNWEEVVRLARLLEKRGAMPQEALRSIAASARAATLAARSDDARELDACWRTIPDAERRQPKIAAAAAKAYLKLKNCRSAHRIIEEALSAEWDADLVRIYGQCREEALVRIDRAERWLAERPKDAELLLALGRLCMAGELWGKARSYLEASLAVHPGRAAHVVLAELCERTGRADEANVHYRAAAAS
ncbi:MAG: heme biosynthesis protein HemY [Betaproteobacteria bacterium]|nr:heme biosynthesis protein HemY [Betaproteobacteria bacterium]